MAEQPADPGASETGEQPVDAGGSGTAQRLCDVGESLGVWRVPTSEVREQDVNARAMPPEMFERLTATIQKEGRLESLPFTVKRDGVFELISGHHRIRAARVAGLKDVIVLADERDLDRSQVVAKQLAHNAIGGVDDQETLRGMFAELTRVDDMAEAYLDPDQFDDVSQVNSPNLPNIEAEFPWRYLSFVFLPAQLEQFNDVEEVIKKVPKNTDEVGVCNKEVYDRFAEALTGVGRAENIRSVGAIISRMTEICLEYIEQQADDDGEANGD